MEKFIELYTRGVSQFIHSFIRCSSERMERLVLIQKRRRSERKKDYYGNLGQQCVHIESLPWLTCFHFQCYAGARENCETMTVA